MDDRLDGVRVLVVDDDHDSLDVAVTVYGRTQDRAAALNAGYAMHVPKPVDPGELTAIVASLVQARAM